MFRANMCPSSGETTVFVRHLILVILCGWLSGMQQHMLMHTSHPHGITSIVFCLVRRSICSCIPDSHPHRITSTKCRINTVVSPDDGRIVARNMWRLINILRINCAPSWLYLQECTGMHDQQNTKYLHKFHSEILRTVLHSVCVVLTNNLCVYWDFDIFSFENPGSTSPSYICLYFNLILKCLSPAVDSLQFDIIEFEVPFDYLLRTNVCSTNEVLPLR